MISEVDIDVLKKNFGLKTELWKQAFKEYNENNERPMSFMCRPCWYKVLTWHTERIKANEVNYGQDTPLGKQHTDQEKRYFDPK